MAWWRKSADEGGMPKGDSGAGSLSDYRYGLEPRNDRVVIRLAGSDPYQGELARLLPEEELQTAGGQRTPEEERTDAPMEVRLFTGSAVTGVVGLVPRGLESAVSEAFARLEQRGEKPRIPARVVTTRQGLRVELLIGRTR